MPAAPAQAPRCRGAARFDRADRFEHPRLGGFAGLTGLAGLARLTGLAVPGATAATTAAIVGEPRRCQLDEPADLGTGLAGDLETCHRRTRFRLHAHTSRQLRQEIRSQSIVTSEWRLVKRRWTVSHAAHRPRSARRATVSRQPRWPRMASMHAPQTASRPKSTAGSGTTWREAADVSRAVENGQP